MLQGRRGLARCVINVVMDNESKLFLIIATMVGASAAIHFSIGWIRKHFPVHEGPVIAQRPFTTFEYALGLLPLLVFLGGGFGFFYRLERVGLDGVTLPGTLAYIGILFLGMLAVPKLIARLIGRNFYETYYRLGELHSGISTGGANVFVVSIGGGFLLGAAACYVIESFS